MKKVLFNNLSYIPASHEDPHNPGALKKILFTEKDINPGGKIRMINWVLLPKGKSFTRHYHEDMDEIFIIVSGRVRIQLNHETGILEEGDAVLVPMRTIHKMKNIGRKDVNYIVLGLTLGKGGKTRIKL